MSNPISAIQDHGLTLARQSQTAAAAVAGAWTRSLQESSIRVPFAAGRAAANELIDQMFDFAVQVIDVQRNLSKQFVSQSVTAAEGVAYKATSAANETTGKVAKAALRAARSA